MTWTAADLRQHHSAIAPSSIGNSRMCYRDCIKQPKYHVLVMEGPSWKAVESEKRNNLWATLRTGVNQAGTILYSCRMSPHRSHPGRYSRSGPEVMSHQPDLSACLLIGKGCNGTSL
uniref:Uncharacterized protein n=1 Tax=Oryza nivara TaxID=4536 RepID=A0A0E0I7U7_ORYNI